MKEDRIRELFALFLEDHLSSEELIELQGLIQDKQHGDLFDQLLKSAYSDSSFAEDDQDAAKQVWGKVKEKIENSQLPLHHQSATISLWKKIAAAAAILLVVGAGVFFYTSRHLEGSAATRDLLANDIKPGGNKAYLTLANGKKLSLSDAANGALAKEAGVEITKTADGQIIYTVKGPSLPSASLPGGARDSDGVKYLNALNTIETPRGGQYQVRLPDGTKVWLNAASKLVYPVAFNGREDRRVELSGEAYFEVAKDKQHPFKVKSNGQEVEVLGTHFNINSYADERGTKTTLLEGSVRVNNQTTPPVGHPSLREGGDVDGADRSRAQGGNALAKSPPSLKEGWSKTGVVLKPNQQSINDGRTIKVSEADPSEAVAWKNGFFLFNGDDLPTVLRQISRWYDLEIKYEGKIPKRSFDGKIYRSLNLSKALEVLKYSNVKFKLEGRTLIINENN